MALRIDIVDAFTSENFKGNSAAVVLLEQWLDKSLMQSIAMENNLSETAFVVPNDAGEYDIRWFSPLTEVDFCGHATLAASFVLFATYPHLDDITFCAPAVGKMPVQRVYQQVHQQVHQKVHDQANHGYIQMTFPNRKPTPLLDVPDALLKGLSIPPESVLINEQAYVVIYPNEQAVRQVIPNPELLKTLGPRDVVVTAKATAADYHFVSRYFWPANGGIEDPVTGSIHTALAPYWAEQLGLSELMAHQASSRGGDLHCQVSPDTVVIRGTAVHYMTGTILL